MAPPVWHYACAHSAEGIRADGLIKPNPQPLLGNHALSWFTDLGREHRYAVGLTSTVITCDRMEYRFEVDLANLLWWPRAARQVDAERSVRDALEAGRLPAHWWVAFDPVPVLAEA